MLHEASKSVKALLHDFMTCKLICKFEFAIQSPALTASETKEHASNQSVTCANRTIQSQDRNGLKKEDNEIYSTGLALSALKAGHSVYLWLGNSRAETPDSPHVQTSNALKLA